MPEPAIEVFEPAPSYDRAPSRDLRGLMVRYQAGDPLAIDELVRAVSPLLMPFLASSGLPPSDADDLLQDCWMRIHRSRHTYRPGEPLLPWIFAIARHARLDHWRSRRRRSVRELLLPELPERGHLPHREAESQERFHKLLAGLPESQREVILLLKVSGMSLEEVARATSSTVGAIKQKVHRAYATLRLVLEKERG